MLSRLLLTLLALITGVLAPGVSASARVDNRATMAVGTMATTLPARSEGRAHIAARALARPMPLRAFALPQRVPTNLAESTAGFAPGIDRARE